MSYSLLSSLQLALPLLFLAGALPGERRWQRAVALNASAAVLTLLVAVLVPALSALELTVASVGQVGNPTAAGEAIAVLVGFLGTVIARYSSTFLRGEPGRDRFLTHLQMTLAGVACVVLTDHMLILVAGWVAISLSLHRLLLFYPNRQRAVLASHKKFLLARSAESLLLAAVLLLYSEFGTWQLSELRLALATTAPGASASIAAVLIAVVALIKCAQLPVHGWLIQVVEAPTPVSALLHAGVINLGGYLLIAFAGLLGQVPAAQWLVLIVAGATLVLAALIMGLQTSVKVRLAWSTSAQMGLMLVQCAMGLHTLALLHLLAHACYKAYSFLSAGSAVELNDLRRRAGRSHGGVKAWLTAGAGSAVAVTVAAYLLGPGGVISPWLLLFALVTFVLFERGAQNWQVPQLATLSLALIMIVAYVGQKLAITALIPMLNAAPPAGADLWVSALIVLMSVLFWLVRDRNGTSLGRAVSGWLFAGLYLDEWFTRMTLALWPLRLPERMHGKQITDSSREAY
jgi:NAD(P)H-quinone oxidoreductase subunit 5